MAVMTAQSSREPRRDDGPGPARFSGRQLGELPADDAWLDELVDRADEGGVALTGPATSSHR